MLTLEEAKELAKGILANLIHYPKKARTYYADDLTAIAIAIMKMQNAAKNEKEKYPARKIV